MQGTSTTINGLDMEKLAGLVEAIERDPRAGVAGFRVATSWTGGAASTTRVFDWAIGGERKVRGFEFKSDEPTELLGDASAPNPQELLMGALNACMMVGFVAGCALKGVRLESLDFVCEGELDLRGFLGLSESVKPGYERIHIEVRVRGDGTPAQYEEVMEMVRKTSPNYFNITRPVVVTAGVKAV